MHQTVNAMNTEQSDLSSIVDKAQRYGMTHGQGNVPTTSIILSTGIQVLGMQTQFPQLPAKEESYRCSLFLCVHWELVPGPPHGY